MLSQCGTLQFLYWLISTGAVHIPGITCKYMVALMTPRAFSAVQRYIPTSSTLAEKIFTVWFLLVILILLEIGSSAPSFVQVTCGIGVPATLHLSRATSPADMFNRLGECSWNCGGDCSERCKGIRWVAPFIGYNATLYQLEKQNNITTVNPMYCVAEINTSKHLIPRVLHSHCHPLSTLSWHSKMIYKITTILRALWLARLPC